MVNALEAESWIDGIILQRKNESGFSERMPATRKSTGRAGLSDLEEHNKLRGNGFDIANKVNVGDIGSPVWLFWGPTNRDARA
jgi:hypothetical protein